MEHKDDLPPNRYEEILKKIEKIEKALDLSKIDEITRQEELVEEKQTIKEEEKNEEEEEELQISPQPEVVLKPRAYLKFAKHALKYANSNIPEKEWIEVIGIVTGYIINENTPLEKIIVEDYHPVAQGDAISVEILDHKIFTELLEKNDSKNFIVGWAHSHPSYTPYLSKDDFRTHLRYQAFWDKSIALVIDPLLISSENHGFEVFRIDENKQSYYNLSCEVEGMSTEACYESLTLIMDTN